MYSRLRKCLLRNSRLLSLSHQPVISSKLFSSFLDIERILPFSIFTEILLTWRESTWETLLFGKMHKVPLSKRIETELLNNKINCRRICSSQCILTFLWELASILGLDYCQVPPSLWVTQWWRVSLAKNDPTIWCISTFSMFFRFYRIIVERPVVSMTPIHRETSHSYFFISSNLHLFLG